jgi:hypothetical protein
MLQRSRKAEDAGQVMNLFLERKHIPLGLVDLKNQVEKRQKRSDFQGPNKGPFFIGKYLISVLSVQFISVYKDKDCLFVVSK